MSKVIVRVDNRIRLSMKAAGAAVVSALKSAHEHTNPEIQKLRHLGYSTHRVPEILRTWRVEGDEISLPRGGMQRVRHILRENRIDFVVEDHRSEGQPIRGKLKYGGWPLRPHQIGMVKAGLAKEQCILRAATGSGKTEAAFALAAEIGLNTMVILPTKELFNQWAKRAKRCLGISGNQLGIIQGKTRRLRPLTIAMQATLARGVHEDVRDFFGTVIVDETQRAAADSLVRAVDTMPSRYRIGVSASEKRKDKKECLIYDLFSGVAFEAGREELMKKGVIVEVEIRIIPTDFAADWYRYGNLDFNRLLDEMVVDEKRNRLGLQVALDEVRKNEQVIMLTHRREHARTLDRFFVEQRVTSGLLLGDGQPGDAEEFKTTREGIENRKTRVGIGTYGAIGYGIDLPAVSVGVAMTPIATNPQQFNQVRGRLCRLSEGKTHGRMYVLVDTRISGTKHIRNICAWNEVVKVHSKGKWIEGRDYIKSLGFRG